VSCNVHVERELRSVAALKETSSPASKHTCSSLGAKCGKCEESLVTSNAVSVVDATHIEADSLVEFSWDCCGSSVAESNSTGISVGR
jgi:hypothetical protein